jgi:hypothetical protein
MNLGLAMRVLRDNWGDPSWWRGSFYPFAKRTAVMNALKPYYAVAGPSGVDFMAEDWDNLLLLDACRYDMFAEHNWLPGDLQTRISLAASTPEFVTKTFGGETYHDTVYVTANPQLTLRVDDEVFHHVERVWDTGWDEDLSTVRPETMADRTRKMVERFPDKRIIGHFMQPHYPFIGKLGQSELDDQAGFELTKRLASGEEAKRDGDSIWDRLEQGAVDEEVVWEAYVENLEVVLEAIEDLVSEFDERTVVTSDHGNLIGETIGPIPISMYGHPTGIHAENLVTVPWLVNQGDRRKSITSEPPSAADTSYDTGKLEDRLADLGYAD